MPFSVLIVRKYIKFLFYKIDIFEYIIDKIDEYTAI